MECKDCKRTDVRCCNTCAKDSSKCEVWHDCGAHCKYYKSKPKTNADKIRNMSDEELADICIFYDAICDGYCCIFEKHIAYPTRQEATKQCLKYLKQEVRCK